MVKRGAWKRYAYIAFALLVLVMSWEANRSNAFAYVSEGSQTAIPQEAIRLRILAHSDAPLDQWIKREVRDVIVEEMASWANAPQDIDTARQMIQDRLPELAQLIKQTLKDHGFAYGAQAELGIVPFPTKMYGTEVYPAGDYEALRVTLGDGQGQNWWCVLFPPLCFVDSEMVIKKNKAYAEEAPEEEANADQEQAVSTSSKSELSQNPLFSAQMDDSEQAGNTEAEASKPEVRFFLVELFDKIASWFA